VRGGSLCAVRVFVKLPLLFRGRFRFPRETRSQATPAISRARRKAKARLDSSVLRPSGAQRSGVARCPGEVPEPGFGRKAEGGRLRRRCGKREILGWNPESVSRVALEFMPRPARSAIRLHERTTPTHYRPYKNVGFVGPVPRTGAVWKCRCGSLVRGGSGFPRRLPVMPGRRLLFPETYRMSSGWGAAVGRSGSLPTYAADNLEQLFRAVRFLDESGKPLPRKFPHGLLFVVPAG